ncbi:MAG TPA: PilZ domain-containing protein [Cellvibrionaceae bacterium]
MNDERRLRKRVNLSVYLAATDATSQDTIGNLIDISAAGFLLLTERTLNQQGTLSINIQLPEPIETLSVINVIAQIIRSKSSHKPKFYETAFEITYASSQTKRIIEILQDQWHLHLPNQ